MSTTSQSSRYDQFVEYQATRDVSLRNALVEEYRPLALALVRRQSSTWNSREDLLQAAYLALIAAVERFDPSRGIAFTTFAWTTMQGAVKRHYRDHTWLVRPPRDLQERFLVTRAAVDELTAERGSSPTIRQVAERTRQSEEEVIEAMEVRNAYVPGSLDSLARPDGEPTPDLSEEEPGFAATDNTATLGALLARLPDVEREIVRLRFVEQMSQSEIALTTGISQMQVSRVLARTLAKLRGWIDA